jgi:hypothetical protein
MTLNAVNKWFFGGKPSEVFASRVDGKHSVLKRKNEVFLAKRNCEALKRELNLDSDGSDFNSLFAYMVSYTEVNGASGKSDHVKCLADLCASLSVVSLIGGFVLPVCLACKGLPWWQGPLAFACALLVAFFSMCLAVDYVRTRYSIVVRAYDVLQRKRHETESEHSQSHLIRGRVQLSRIQPVNERARK